MNFNVYKFNSTCLDHNASKTRGVWLQRERGISAKIFHIVQFVRGTAQQAGTLRFWIKEHPVVLTHTWRSETRASY